MAGSKIFPIFLFILLIFSLQSSPQEFHTIYGFVHGGGKAVENAKVTLENERTGETLIKTTDVNGFYSFQLANLPSGWKEGDILKIKVEGKGNYEGWNGVKEVVIDASIPAQRVNISLSFPLTASFTYSPENPRAGDEVWFNATATSSAEITSWEWNFGDGSNATGKNVSHVYEDAGNYTVLLTVMDSVGRIFTMTKDINVSPKEGGEEEKNASPSLELPAIIVTIAVMLLVGKRFK